MSQCPLPTFLLECLASYYWILMYLCLIKVAHAHGFQSHQPVKEDSRPSLLPPQPVPKATFSALRWWLWRLSQPLWNTPVTFHYGIWRCISFPHYFLSTHRLIYPFSYYIYSIMVLNQCSLCCYAYVFLETSHVKLWLICFLQSFCVSWLKMILFVLKK